MGYAGDCALNLRVPWKEFCQGSCFISRFVLLFLVSSFACGTWRDGFHCCSFHCGGSCCLRCSLSAVSTSESASVKAFSDLKSANLFDSEGQTLNSVQNGSRVQCMQVWNPIGMTKFETFSYLPALSDDQIAKQVDYMIQQNLIPRLEFDVSSEGVSRANNQTPGYYDGRCWTMWKLPMFGATTPLRCCVRSRSARSRTRGPGQRITSTLNTLD